MSALPDSLHTFASNDSDSQETREWMDALRGHALLGQHRLREHHRA